jgi:hypothetical protein
MTSSNWWANKLGGAPSTSPTPATTPPAGNVYHATPGAPNTPVTYDPNQDQLVTKAQSQKSNSRCPNCSSGNYMKVGTQSNQGGMFDVMRCYDCGYPKTQTGTGAGFPTGSGGPATPAKQPAKGTGFNPSVIVDRIG